MKKPCTAQDIIAHANSRSNRSHLTWYEKIDQQDRKLIDDIVLEFCNGNTCPLSPLADEVLPKLSVKVQRAQFSRIIKKLISERRGINV